MTEGAAGVVSVIVLNFNGKRWLRPCLDALAAQRGAPPFEVLVVDNASSDGSAGVVRDYIRDIHRRADPAAFRTLQLVETGRNLGFAAGNNAGVRDARGSVLAFLNNDTVAEPDWLGRLYEAIASATRIRAGDFPPRISGRPGAR